MKENGAVSALRRYLKVHGRRILSTAGAQREVRIEIRALFRYYERKDKDDRLVDHLGEFKWEGCRVEGDYVIVPISIIRDIVKGGED